MGIWSSVFSARQLMRLYGKVDVAESISVEIGPKSQT